MAPANDRPNPTKAARELEPGTARGSTPEVAPRGCRSRPHRLAPGFPFNLPDLVGAIALVLDPSGHPVGMYSRTPLPPVLPTAK
jgi:hypothetical protein